MDCFSDLPQRTIYTAKLGQCPSVEEGPTFFRSWSIHERALVRIRKVGSGGFSVRDGEGVYHEVFVYNLLFNYPGSNRLSTAILPYSFHRLLLVFSLLPRVNHSASQ